ncbi:hypothetical protein [Streptomyces sp. NBC_01506]|uniref:hypothetical protein n=1 Tax=Streptomyces sp. NBC_01506 TaxID=2903887 RepID=UPI002F91A2A3
MSTYQQERRAADAQRAEQAREDRRLDMETQLKAKEIKAEQQRANAAAAEERRALRQREDDERQARLAKQQRADKQAEKKAKQQAKAERKAARATALTPGNVYRLGTLALVTASALGSLPAQIIHFAHLSWMLLPLPLSIEGAAWVFAAGVAFADARKLPAWVRWLLRGFILGAAGFAATINYQYGRSLSGLTDGESLTAGIGLAAVSLLGPLMFEIRQWVSTLDEQTGSVEDKKRRKEEAKAEKERQEHLDRRRKDHKEIAQAADRLMSALPFGSITPEDAFATAWEIENGATSGFTAETFARATSSKVQLGAAFELGEHVRPELLRTGLMVSALNPLSKTLPKLGPVTQVPVSRPGAKVPTTQAGIGLYGSQEASQKASESASEKASRGRTDEELEQLLPEALRAAAELVAEGRQISAAALAKHLKIRREDGMKLRDRVIAERKLRLIGDDGDAAAVGA